MKIEKMHYYYHQYTYNLRHLDMQGNRLTKVEYDAKLTFLIVTHPQ